MTITVANIYQQARKIFGSCDQDTLFGHITNAVEILSNIGDFDPLLGYVDICTQNNTCLVLPREVDTVLAVNIGGQPTVGRDQMFRFHFNGPGDCKQSCEYSWIDRNRTPVYQPLGAPSKLVSYVQRAEDANAELWAYGFDAAGNSIRSFNSGAWVDGYQVPTLGSVAMPDGDAPEFMEVTRVRKAITAGSIRLSSYDNSATTGTLLGIYQWDEEEPSYRKIELSQACGFARVAFRRSVFEVNALTDVLPLQSKTAILFMLRALKFYDESDLARGERFELNARRYLVEAAEAHQSNVTMPPIINDNFSITDVEDIT